MARLNAKPLIRIESASVVAQYGDEDYVLGPVRMGIRSAIRQVLTTKQEDLAWRSSEATVETAIRKFFRIRERLYDSVVQSAGSEHQSRR